MFGMEIYSLKQSCFNIINDATVTYIKVKVRLDFLLRPFVSVWCKRHVKADFV